MNERFDSHADTSAGSNATSTSSTSMPTERRLRRHLADVAGRAAVPPSTPAVARRRAHALTIRRRRAAVGGLAAACVVGAVVGVRALAEPSRSSIRTVDTPSVDTDEFAPPGTGTGRDGDVTGAGDDRIDATSTDPAFVWKVVEPDKDRAVTFDYGATGTFPTLALSTAPGRSNDYDDIETVVWATDDGIEWEQTGISSPFGPSGVRFWQSTMVGGNLFAVGTAPGIAASDVNPLQVAVNSVDGGDWSTVALPLDANEHRDLPMAQAQLHITRIPLDDVVMVAVTPEISVDYERLGVELDDRWISHQTDAGVVVAADECVDTADSSVMTVPTVTGTAAGRAPVAPTTAWSDDEPATCQTSELTWDEIGVPPETVEAIESRATRIFLVDADLSVREIESPVPGAALVSFDPVRPRFTLSSVRDTFAEREQPTSVEVFEYDGVAWTASEQSLRNWAHTPAPFGDALAGFTRDEHGLSFTIARAGGVTSHANVTPLFEEQMVLYEGAARPVVAGGNVVTAVAHTPDMIARAGGVELTVDGVTARKDDLDGAVYFVEAATGERIPDDRVRHHGFPSHPTDYETALANGADPERAIAVTILDGDGETMAEFTAQQMYNDLEGAAYQEQGVPYQTTYSLLTTADGVSFSAESVADLLGVDEAAVSHIQRVATDGSTVVVAVAMNERHPDDRRVQLVLVGTPIG